MTQDNDQVARTWAMWCHLSALAWLPLILLGSIGILLPIPFLNIVGPLIVWLTKKEQHPFIDAHGKESLNFQISFTIYGVIAAIVFFFVIAVTCGVGLSNTSSSQLLSQIGLVLAVVGGVCSLIVGILQLVLIIFAAIKAKKGELYHYPFTLRFLR
ncbi:MAG TPA: DUF4870 domain-containing protein [Allocoleopsis sp.]